MIYVVHDIFDLSSQKVIKVLKSKGIPHKGLCGNDLINPIRLIKINNEGIDIVLKSGERISDSDVFWFRRGYFSFIFDSSYINESSTSIKEQIRTHLNEEANSLLYFF